MISERSPIRKLKALVVDDDEVQRTILKKILKRYLNFEVVEAVNGEDALRTMRADRPDVVILDVMMPVMDGFDVLSSVRADPSLCSLPVIVSSAVTEKNQVLKLLTLKVDDYLVKPIRQDEVMDRLSPIIDRLVQAQASHTVAGGP